MAEISVNALTLVDAAPQDVRAALADYRDVRPALLTEEFTGYEVLDGGVGPGTRARWTLRPGRRRTREWEVLVEESDGGLVERDSRSEVVTTWTVRPAPDDRTLVEVRLTWAGHGGFAELGERLHAGNLRRVYGEVLLKLRNRFAREAAARTAAPGIAAAPDGGPAPHGTAAPDGGTAPPAEEAGRK